MITQIKPSRIKNEEDIINLEIHPKIRQKIRVGKKLQKRIESRLKATDEKGILFKQEELNECESIGSDSPRSVRKLESITPGSQRKGLRHPRLSSYQLYKEQQKEIKVMHKDKINDWKMKIWNKRAEDKSRGQSRNFTRSKSYIEQGSSANKRKDSIVDTINAYKLNTISKTIESSPRSRSLYIKTNEGKKRIVDNRKYLQRLKICLEINPLSTFNFLKTPKTLQPEVFALSPKNKEKTQEKKESFRSHNQFKKKQERKTKPKIEFHDSLCRPWSGIKGDHCQELPAFIHDN